MKRPGATPNDVVDEVIAEATDPGHSSAPPPSEDLFEPTNSHVGAAADEVAGAGEDRWEFDEVPEPPMGREPAAMPERTADKLAVERSAASETDEDLDSLGSPAEWDLLTGAAERLAKDASFQPEPAPSSVRTAAPAVPKRKQAAPAEEAAPREAPISSANTATEPDSPAWRDALASGAQAALRGAVWIGASALCAVGLALALSPASLPKAALAKQVFAAPAGVSDLSVRSVESAVAGQLTVVRGEIAPGAARTRVRVAWLDDAGKPLAAAVAGTPVAEAQLRELGLARIRAAHEQRSDALAGGGSFEAVFAALPEGAASIAVMRERLPEPPAPPSPPTSSDPSALPASE